MQKLETGGLGGSFKPSPRPTQSTTYDDINRGLGKAMKYGQDLFEGIMDEVFDVKIGKHKVTRKTMKRKAKFFK